MISAQIEVYNDLLSLLDAFEQATNSVDKNSKKSTETLDHLKFPSKLGFRGDRRINTQLQKLQF